MASKNWATFAAICAALLGAACEAPDPRRTNFRVQKDGVIAYYNDKTGLLRRTETDLNKNGTMDTFTQWEGTRMIRVEEDLDENGRIERWTYLREGRIVDKVGTSTKGDGVEDTWEILDAAGGLVATETDTNRDGVVDQRYRYADDPATPGRRVALMAELELDGSRTPKYRVRFRPDGSVVGTETVR